MNDDLRFAVRKRAHGRCEYCGIPDEYHELFGVDHVIAKKHRGPTILSNLAWTCFACNSFKGTNLSGVRPKTGRVARLFRLRRDKWSDHFRWRGGVIVGKTSIARATIEVLELNLPVRIDAREALMEEGVFSQ